MGSDPTNVDIASLRALLDKATPRPWHYSFGRNEIQSAGYAMFKPMLNRAHEPVARLNADLVVAAVNSLASLLARVERAEEALAFLVSAAENVVRRPAVTRSHEERDDALMASESKKCVPYELTALAMYAEQGRATLDAGTGGA